MPKVIDLTQPIRPSMPVFPTDPRPVLLPWSSRTLHGYDSEVLHLGTHTGTHIDAPSHFLAGAASVDGIPCNRYVAQGVVLDLRDLAPREPIGRATLERAVSGKLVLPDQAVLLWTGWAKRWNDPLYVSDYPGLSADGAEYLLGMRVSLVGVDTINLDAPQEETFPAHRALLGAGVPVVENLANLEELQGEAAFLFAALPLRLEAASGSPVRAVALAGGWPS